MHVGMDVYAPDVYSIDGYNWPVPTGEAGYFRDTYRRDSLANWLAANIDPGARGQVGLAIFSEPPCTLNSPEWREELLLKARQWNTAAEKLAGKSSFIGTPGHDLQVVDEAGTRAYIEWTGRLLRFAEVVYATGSPVKVDA
ncbi:MAG: hypothetical protein M0000_08720 [Actinomycetota bacterium]|nr:hypothetical protein [Actinomycetota bacterium]